MAKMTTNRQISNYKPTRVTLKQVKKAASFLTIRSMGSSTKPKLSMKKTKKTKASVKGM